MAYNLVLQAHSKIYPVFHVFYLKKGVGENCRVQTPLPKLNSEGSIWHHSVVVLATQEHHLSQHTIKKSLPQWKYLQPKDATCELSALLQQFSIASLEDKAAFEWGGHVRVLP